MKLQDIIDKLNALPEEYRQLDIYEDNEIWGLIELVDSKFDFTPRRAYLFSGKAYGRDVGYWTLYTNDTDKAKDFKDIIILYGAYS